MLKEEFPTNFLMGALVGGAIGAAAALLLTPVSGSDLRKQVQKSLKQLNGKTQVLVEKKAAPVRKKRRKTASK